MAYRQFPFRGFGGGLNLLDGPDVVQENQAIDLRNVLFSTRGAVKQRPGYRKLTAAEGTNRYDSLSAFYKVDGTKQLVAGAGNRLEAINAAGSVITSSAAPTASPHFFQRFGGPTAEHLYIANGTDNLRRWDGAAFSSPVFSGVTPDAKFLGLMATENRLVAARFNGTVAGDNPSTVRFSMEGDPTTFNADHYTDLTPGDGEEITGVASWRHLVIVFKQTKFFVVYGTSVDDENVLDFNVRPVDAGVGLASPRALAVAEEGVYFLDRSGIYYTDGNEPKHVSDAVRPIFDGDPSIYFTGGSLNHAQLDEVTMVKWDGRLLLSYPADEATANNRQLVYDLRGRWWSLYDLPAGPMTVFRTDDRDELIFGYSSGLKHLGRHVEAMDVNDDVAADGTGGSAVNAYWQSGWFNYDLPLIKTIRELKLAGLGVVVVSIYRDYRQSTPHMKTVTLTLPGVLYDDGTLYDDGSTYGPDGVLQTKSMRRAVRGEAFSVRLSNAVIDQDFHVHRLTAHVRDTRVPSVAKVR